MRIRRGDNAGWVGLSPKHGRPAARGENGFFSGGERYAVLMMQNAGLLVFRSGMLQRTAPERFVCETSPRGCARCRATGATESRPGLVRGPTDPTRREIAMSPKSEPPPRSKQSLGSCADHGVGSVMRWWFTSFRRIGAAPDTNLARNPNRPGEKLFFPGRSLTPAPTTPAFRGRRLRPACRPAIPGTRPDAAARLPSIRRKRPGTPILGAPTGPDVPPDGR